VLQEILHRYRAIRRCDEGRQVYALARRIVPLVVAITEEIVDRARDLLDGDAQLGARDALHAAIVLDRGMEGICSYDRDLDRIDGWRRFSHPRRRREHGPARQATGSVSAVATNDEGPVPFETGPPSGESA
jgi:predicted nucleic acid-binding protein